MAQRADAVAVDDTDMTKAARNAAIFYATDGYSPATEGINGRRVAGESFLKGYLRHADVDEFVIMAKKNEEAAAVRKLASVLRPEVALRPVGLIRPAGIAPVNTLYYPGPNYASEAWRRAPYGMAAWSICGVTHTTSTPAVMQGLFDLRVAPVMEWDALICTSQAVRASVSYQLDLVDQHLAHLLGARTRPRPIMPVIPLGVHCDDFAPDVALGQGLRKRLGAAPQDVIFTTIARLTPHEKFDPLPIFLAMQAAQRQLTGGQRLHIAFCGQFREPYARKVFEEGAKALMPDVGFALLDGAKAEDRKAVLSGADVFLFMIDNIQETFGLAPLEGMAAGLPMLVSDWDGLKDTVSPDVGFRVTSRALAPRHLAQEALRLQGGIDAYGQYCAATSALTELDMPEMTARILDLARNPDLRRRMGQAGAARARALYDWKAVIPQMQDLWAEQEAMRARHVATAPRYAPETLPVSPSPTGLFAAYPTQREEFGGRFAMADQTGPDWRALLALRNYAAMKRVFASPDQIAAVVAALQGGAGTAREVDTATGLGAVNTERILIWLLKYGLIRRV